MTLAVECLNCGRKLRVPETAAGRRRQCPGCSAEIDIPMPVEEATPPYNLDVDDAPPDEVSLVPGIGAEVGAQAVGLPPRVLPTPPPLAPLAESVNPSATSHPLVAEADTRRATRGVTAMQGYFIIGLLLIGLGAPIFGVLRPPPKWEYKIEKVYSFDSVLARLEINNKIDLMGREGWELVTARLAESGSYTEYEMIFKRPK